MSKSWFLTRNFEVFSDLRLNKRLSKQSWGWWFETPWRSLWSHCYAMSICRRFFFNIVARGRLCVFAGYDHTIFFRPRDACLCRWTRLLKLIYFHSSKRHGGYRLQNRHHLDAKKMDLTIYNMTCTVLTLKCLFCCSYIINSQLILVVHLLYGSAFIRHLTKIGNPIVEIRRSYHCLISTMGFPILVRWHIFIESAPW